MYICVYMCICIYINGNNMRIHIIYIIYNMCIYIPILHFMYTVKIRKHV